MRVPTPEILAALVAATALWAPLFSATAPPKAPQDPPSAGKNSRAATTPAGTPAGAPKDQPLAAFAFMTGRWVQEKGAPAQPETLEETWSPATGDAMVGMFRWTKGSHTWMFELMSLEVTKEGPTLNLRHFSRGLVPWKSEADPQKGALTWTLESQGEHEAVFVNKDRKDVQRVTYRRKGKTLEVLLNGPSGPGMRFAFRKAD